MAMYRYMLPVIWIACLSACSSLREKPIEQAHTYELQKRGSALVIKMEEKEIASIQWMGRKDTCDATFTSTARSFCLQYTGKPDRKIAISENGINLAHIQDIKKQTSYLMWDNLEYILRPEKGNIVAIREDRVIARISRAKGGWRLDISAPYEQHELLTASLFYKNKVWRQQEESNYDYLFWILLLLIFMI